MRPIVNQTKKPANNQSKKSKRLSKKPISPFPSSSDIDFSSQDLNNFSKNATIHHHQQQFYPISLNSSMGTRNIHSNQSSSPSSLSQINTHFRHQSSLNDQYDESLVNQQGIPTRALTISQHIPTTYKSSIHSDNFNTKLHHHSSSTQNNKKYPSNHHSSSVVLPYSPVLFSSPKAAQNYRKSQHYKKSKDFHHHRSTAIYSQNSSPLNVHCNQQQQQYQQQQLQQQAANNYEINRLYDGTGGSEAEQEQQQHHDMDNFYRFQQNARRQSSKNSSIEFQPNFMGYHNHLNIQPIQYEQVLSNRGSFGSNSGYCFNEDTQQQRRVHSRNLGQFYSKKYTECNVDKQQSEHSLLLRESDYHRHRVFSCNSISSAMEGNHNPQNYNQHPEFGVISQSSNNPNAIWDENNKYSKSYHQHLTHHSSKSSINYPQTQRQLQKDSNGGGQLNSRIDKMKYRFFVQKTLADISIPEEGVTAQQAYHLETKHPHTSCHRSLSQKVGLSSPTKSTIFRDKKKSSFQQLSQQQQQTSNSGTLITSTCLTTNTPETTKLDYNHRNHPQTTKNKKQSNTTRQNSQNVRWSYTNEQLSNDIKKTQDRLNRLLSQHPTLSSSSSQAFRRCSSKCSRSQLLMMSPSATGKNSSHTSNKQLINQKKLRGSNEKYKGDDYQSQKSSSDKIYQNNNIGRKKYSRASEQNRKNSKMSSTSILSKPEQPTNYNKNLINSKILPQATISIPNISSGRNNRGPKQTSSFRQTFTNKSKTYKSNNTPSQSASINLRQKIKGIKLQNNATNSKNSILKKKDSLTPTSHSQNSSQISFQKYAQIKISNRNKTPKNLQNNSFKRDSKRVSLGKTTQNINHNISSTTSLSAHSVSGSAMNNSTSSKSRPKPSVHFFSPTYTSKQKAVKKFLPANKTTTILNNKSKLSYNNNSQSHISKLPKQNTEFHLSQSCNQLQSQEDENIDVVRKRGATIHNISKQYNYNVSRQQRGYYEDGNKKQLIFSFNPNESPHQFTFDDDMHHQNVNEQKGEKELKLESHQNQSNNAQQSYLQFLQSQQLHRQKEYNWLKKQKQREQFDTLEADEEEQQSDAANQSNFKSNCEKQYEYTAKKPRGLSNIYLNQFAQSPTSLNQPIFSQNCSEEENEKEGEEEEKEPAIKQYNPFRQQQAQQMSSISNQQFYYPNIDSQISQENLITGVAKQVEPIQILQTSKFTADQAIYPHSSIQQYSKQRSIQKSATSSKSGKRPMSSFSDRKLAKIKQIFLKFKQKNQQIEKSQFSVDRQKRQRCFSMDVKNNTTSAPSTAGFNFGNVRNRTQTCSINTSIDSIKKYKQFIKNEAPSFSNPNNFIDNNDATGEKQIYSFEEQQQKDEQNIEFSVQNNNLLKQYSENQQKLTSLQSFDPKILSPKSTPNTHLIDQMKNLLNLNSNRKGKQQFEHRSSMKNAQRILLAQQLSGSFSSSSLKGILASPQNNGGSFSNSSCMRSPQKASIAGMSRKNKLGNSGSSLINIRQSQQESIPGLLQKQTSLDLTKTPSSGVMNIPKFLSLSLQGSLMQYKSSNDDLLKQINQSHSKIYVNTKNLEEEEENLQIEQTKSKLNSIPDIPKLSLANIIHKREQVYDQEEQLKHSKNPDIILENSSMNEDTSEILNQKQQNESLINIPYFPNQDIINDFDNQDAVQILSPAMSNKGSEKNNFELSFSNSNTNKNNYQYPKIQSLFLELQKVSKNILRDTFNKLKQKEKIKTPANFNISIGLTYLLSSRLYQRYYQQSIGIKRQVFESIIYWNRQIKAKLRRELNYSPREAAGPKFVKSSILQRRTFRNNNGNSIDSQGSFGMEASSSPRQSPMFKVQMKSGDINGAFTEDQSIFESGSNSYKE